RLAAGHARVPADLPDQLHRQRDPRSQGGEEPVALHHARMDHRVTAAARQLDRVPAGLSRSLRVRRARTGAGLLAPEREGLRMSVKTIATTRSAMGIPTGRLAIWWVLVSEVVIFGGILVSYIMHRLGHPEWAEEAAHTNTWLGAFNTLVLLSSSLSAVLGHKAAEQGNGPKAARCLYFTFLGGLTFLIVKTFEWTHEIPEGFPIQAG